MSSKSILARIARRDFAARKPSKYKAVRTTVDGVTFASRAEAKRDGELRLLEKTGDILKLGRQPRYPIAVNGVKVCTYVGDWVYWERSSSKLVCEDKKGVETPVFKLKIKLARILYPDVEFRIT